MRSDDVTPHVQNHVIQTESTDVETIMISANRWGVMIEAMPRELPANKVSSRAALVAEVADIYKYFMGHVQDSHDLVRADSRPSAVLVHCGTVHAFAPAMRE